LSDDAVRLLLGAVVAEAFERISVDDFFGPLETTDPGAHEATVAEARRFAELRALMEAHLTELAVFRVGEIEIDVYVLGLSACDEAAGVATVSIET
jgi:hypothetical protein